MFGGSERALSIERIKSEMSSQLSPTSVRKATEGTKSATLQNRHTTLYLEHVVTFRLHSTPVTYNIPFLRQVFDFLD